MARDPQPRDRRKDQGEDLSAICILAAGVLRASLPAAEFTLAWEHSVEKTRWEERYVIEGTQLRLAEARIEGFGAGMEPPAGARLVNGWWTWQPKLEPLPELRLTHSGFASDYTICWSAQCRSLDELAGPTGQSDLVILAPCTPSNDAGKP